MLNLPRMSQKWSSVMTLCVQTCGNVLFLRIGTTSYSYIQNCANNQFNLIRVKDGRNSSCRQAKDPLNGVSICKIIKKQIFIKNMLNQIGLIFDIQ